MQAADNILIPDTGPGPVRRPWAAGRTRVPFVLRAVAVGLALTAGQALLACALSDHSTVPEAYGSLSQWDSRWYAHVAEFGYAGNLADVPEGQAPVGFFPGFPLLVRLVGLVTFLPPAFAAVLAAQLASVAFWTYLLLFLRRREVPFGLSAAAVVAVVVHPCAFFLVAGYSESLFLAALLGFLYWSDVGGRAGWWLAVLHGGVMTATRIVGLPLAVVPLVLAVVALFPGRGVRPETRPLSLVGAGLLSVLASLGGLLFFAYCQWQFGRWDLYLVVQKTGWHVEPDYLALLNPEVYRVAGPTWLGESYNPNDFSRLCVPATVLALLGLVFAEVRLAPLDRSGSWRQRLPLYLCGAFMFFLAVSGLANSKLLSLIRYTFCVHAVLVLATVQLLARFPLPRGVSRTVLAAACVLAAVASAALEVMFVRLFVHGEWVA
jgi:hypothetical protein